MLAIIVVGVVIIGGAELLLRGFEVPHYVMPLPSEVGNRPRHRLPFHLAASARYPDRASRWFLPSAPRSACCSPA